MLLLLPLKSGHLIDEIIRWRLLDQHFEVCDSLVEPALFAVSVRSAVQSLGIGLVKLLQNVLGVLEGTLLVVELVPAERPVRVALRHQSQQALVSVDRLLVLRIKAYGFLEAGDGLDERLRLEVLVAAGLHGLELLLELGGGQAGLVGLLVLLDGNSLGFLGLFGGLRFGLIKNFLEHDVIFSFRSS